MSAPAATALAGATVLIVDDDVRNVFALTSALELHGLTVLYADNGAAGIRLLTEHPEVDVVLMDTMMPDLDGNETTRLIRELPGGRELPVVFLTAKAMPGDREASLAAGATEYVTKPVDLDELLALMANWVTPPRRPRRVAPMTGRPRVLAVDDRRENLLALQAILEGLAVEVVSVTSGEDALKRLLTEDYAVILLDAHMPGMDGFETAGHIKQRERTRHIPVLFLTAVDYDPHLAFRGYQAGAVDYITKPFDPWVLRSKVGVFVDLWSVHARLAEQADECDAAAHRHRRRGRAARGRGDRRGARPAEGRARRVSAPRRGRASGRPAGRGGRARAPRAASRSRAAPASPPRTSRRRPRRSRWPARRRRRPVWWRGSPPAPWCRSPRTAAAPARRRPR